MYIRYIHIDLESFYSHLNSYYFARNVEELLIVADLLLLYVFIYVWYGNSIFDITEK